MIRGPVPLTRKHEIEIFDSGSPSLDNWLRHHALQAHRSDSTKVFVAHDKDERVVGFFALSAGSVEPDDAPERIRKGQGRYPIPIALITRLAVDQSHQGKGLGQALLKDALLRIVEASNTIGIRAIHAHAKDEAAKQFYARFGFEPSPIHSLWMFLLMKDIRKSLG